MCRSKLEGGQRCAEHNEYGRQYRNLQARKQYHTRTGNTAAAQEAQQAAAALKHRRDSLLGTGGGTLQPYHMELTAAAEKVLKQLTADGYEPYIVGGSVRDELLGMRGDSKDVDIEVYKATPEQVVASLRKIGQVDEVGRSFGVLKISLDGEDFDVSLPRKDSLNGDGGHRGFTVEVTPELSLLEATSRRDYTVNALMYNHELGFIIDKHTGLEDLKNRVLRHVSDAYDEDPLRVLRGVQMASRFNMTLHPDTVLKAQTLAHTYNTLAVERVQIEFQKLYDKGKTPDKAFQMLAETGWDANFPGLKEINTEQLHGQLHNITRYAGTSKLPKQQVGLMVSAIIASKLSDTDARVFLKHTTVGDDMKNQAYNLSRLQPPTVLNGPAIKTWVKDLPRGVTAAQYDTLHTLLGERCEVGETAAQFGVLNAPEPDLLKGSDVLETRPDERPGPWVKQLLDAARAAQYEEKFTTHEGAVEWLQNTIRV